jgi:hypothetical protein
MVQSTDHGGPRHILHPVATSAHADGENDAHPPCTQAAHDLQKSGAEMFALEDIDFGRRYALEKEIRAQGDAVPAPNAVFDESGNFLLYATLVGVKVVNLVSNVCVRVLGKVENTERFLRIALYQGIPKKVGGGGRGGLGVGSGVVGVGGECVVGGEWWGVVGSGGECVVVAWLVGGWVYSSSLYTSWPECGVSSL